MTPLEPGGPPARPAFERLVSWLTRRPVEDADVRAEIWRLGTRHRGEPLAGAMAELKVADLPPARRALLRACVSRLKRA